MALSHSKEWLFCVKNMKEDKPIKISEILKNYDPVENFKRKHEEESDEDFQEWLNK